MAKKHYYLILDCETATLPFADEIARDSEEKKRIAIAKPLIYDIGWVVMDRAGVIVEKRQFLIAETFAVPQIFDTAYYREKRPYYFDLMKRGEIQVVPWEQAIQAFIEDAQIATYVTAYNAMFDFKKAIPFTELYIDKVYSNHYQEWEERQRNICKRIARKDIPKPQKEFDPLHFVFRDKTYDLIDLWGLSCERLINTAEYKKNALLHGMVSPSGIYFKTSAEATYRYLADKWDFAEAHTALEDVLLERQILAKILSRRGKSLTPGITYFPFRELGKTVEFIKGAKGLTFDHHAAVYRAIQTYLDDIAQPSAFVSHLESQFEILRHIMIMRFQETRGQELCDLMRLDFEIMQLG